MLLRARSNRNGAMRGGSELWHATRADASAPWTVDQADLQSVSAPGDQAKPHLSPDLLRIYLAGESRLEVATRSREHAMSGCLRP